MFENSHNMIKEIKEQPEVVRKIIAKRLDFNNKIISFPELDDTRDKLKKIKHVIFLGCGSSAYAATLGNYYFEELAGINSEVEYADEFISRKAVVSEETMVIVLSQSGETADILKACSKAQEQDAVVIGFTNNLKSSLRNYVDALIDLEAGEEKAMAATKSFMTEILELLLFACSAGEKFIDLKGLPEKLSEALKLEEKIKKIAEQLKHKESLIVLGRKYNYPIALEGAHKMKETTYIHAEGYSSEEFRHGPNAIIEKGWPVIIIMPDDNLFEPNLQVLKEMKNTGAFVIALSGKEVKEADEIITLSKADELIMPLINLVPLQLLSYYIAVVKGIDVDRPRNLKKFISKS